MKNIYENINTFSDEIYKSDLREKILNPLIVQHNNMGLDITNLDTRVDKIEANGGAGGVDKFEDLKDVPTYEANKFLKVNGSGDLEWGAISTSGDETRFEKIESDVADHSVRIADLESNTGGGSGGASTFKELSDTPSSYSGMRGKVLAVNSSSNGLEFIDVPSGGSGSGVSTFREMTDTPSSYSGQGGKVVAVNPGGTALEFINAPSGGSGSEDFKGLSDTPSSYSGKAGQLVRVNSSSTGLEFTPYDYLNIDGRQIEYTWDANHLPTAGGKTLTQAQVAKRSFFISATSGTTSNLTIHLPGISEYNVEPTDTEIPGGRMLMFANTGASTMILNATQAGLQVVSGSSGGASTITIGAGKFAHLMAVCRSTGGYKNYHVMAAGSTTDFS